MGLMEEPAKSVIQLWMYMARNAPAEIMGCLETLVNEQRLVREVATGLKMGRESVLDGIEDYDSITLKQIMQAAEDGDILCRNALDRMAELSCHWDSQYCDPLFTGDDCAFGRDDLPICLFYPDGLEKAKQNSAKNLSNA